MLAVALGVVAVVVAAVGNTHWHLNPLELQIASGVVIPLVVGWITKLHASSAVKAITNFLLSAIAGGLTVALASNGDVVVSTWFVGIAQTFVVSIVTYYGLWQHVGVTAAIQQSSPNFGLGTPVPASDTSVGTTGSRDDILPVPPAEQLAGPDTPEPADAAVQTKPQARKRTK